jgi:hypothetical protein
MKQVLQLRKELKEPEKDDTRSFGWKLNFRRVKRNLPYKFHRTVMIP